MSYKVIQSWTDKSFSLTKGDIVTALDHKPSQGLVYVTKQNSEGWIPSSCLSPVDFSSAKQAPFVLSGIYYLVFQILEPISTFAGASTWFTNTEWLFHSLVPAPGTQPEKLSDRTRMAVWQLGNSWFLLGLMSIFVYPAVKRALPGQIRAQEQIVGAVLAALAIADITHLVVTVIGLPQHVLYDISSWNATTHGNITTVIVLFLLRCAWFMGIGRQTAAKTVSKNH
ncbi:hypothetical protein FRC03_008772 [Tulasnella sp. 419]|nr:hypothetical protein FRC03_008772 [Tulasnella sp. 419]